MVGHPKHVKKALAVGVDIICAQGTGRLKKSLQKYDFLFL